MDSAYGWVLSGEENALAYAAYNRGFDVFLGNIRGAPPQRCATEATRRRYWRYSISDVGVYDISAIVEAIHDLKDREAREEEEVRDGDGDGDGKRRGGCELSVIAHSLGGAALLIHLTESLRRGVRSHGLSRLVLLSPAGIHHTIPLLAKIACALDSYLGWWLKDFNFGMTVHGSIVRMGAQKIAVDVTTLPGVDRLATWFSRLLFGGDASVWGGEMIAPYMAPYIQSMPGIGWCVIRHGNQCVRAGTFVNFDYGSGALNGALYGQSTPPLVKATYSRVDIPVDFVGGSADGVVESENVKRQFRDMKEAGVDCTYKEFNMGHLQFTFDPPEDFTRYVLSRLEM